MAKFRLEIECDNEAFEDSVCDEVARILNTLADGDTICDATDFKRPIYDTNGNRVGFMSLDTGG